VTWLTHNYRAHPSLLELPSRLFYQARLVAAAQKDTLPPVWEELEQQGQGGPSGGVHTDGSEAPASHTSSNGSTGVEGAGSWLPSAVFYGVRGSQQQDMDAPSFHNALEAAQVGPVIAVLERCACCLSPAMLIHVHDTLCHSFAAQVAALVDSLLTASQVGTRLLACGGPSSQHVMSQH
jgi:hypothetical protein